MNTCEDMLVTDIERIKRARAMMNNPSASRRDKGEAIRCIELYRELSNLYLVRGTEEQRERAEEILYELNKR